MNAFHHVLEFNSSITTRTKQEATTVNSKLQIRSDAAWWRILYYLDESFLNLAGGNRTVHWTSTHTNYDTEEILTAKDIGVLMIEPKNSLKES